MQDETTVKKQNRSNGFYEAKGLARYMLIIGKQHKEKIDMLAERFKIAQSNVIEVLLDNMNVEDLAPAFQEKANSRGGRGRKAAGPTQRDLINQLKGMTPEQLEAAQKAILAAKATPAVPA